MPQVDPFLAAVRRRLNRGRALHALLWSGAAGALLLLGVSAFYLSQGLAVPRICYGVTGGLSLLAGIMAAWLRRADDAEAARVADAVFDLKDALTSRRRFDAEGKSGGFYEMQKARTEEAVAGLSAAVIPLPWPRKLACACGLLVFGAVLTASKSPSPEVVARLQQEELTAARTEEIRREMEELIRELESGAEDPDERELLNPDELKKWVDDLKSTRDLAEALRQMAELERRMDGAAKALEQKREEQLLKNAAEELEKENDPQARALARNLKNGQLREAARELEKLQPESAEQQNASEKRRELAKLGAAATRMAAAARNQQAKNQSSGDPAESGQNQAGRMANDTPLNEMLEQLEQEAKRYNQALTETEKQEKSGKIDISKLSENEERKDSLKEKTGQLGDKLKKMAAQKAAAQKLHKLARTAGQSQNLLAGQGRSPFGKERAGKPGDGTAEDRRDAREEVVDNGQTTQLQGQKGTGPSLSQIEAADDGTGVSSRRSEAKEREFRRQFESFVQREDVPAEVKDGVKEYFKAIHQSAGGGQGDE